MAEHLRRKQYFTDFSIQFRYLTWMCLMLLSFLGVAMGIVYFTGWSTLIERLSQVYPQGRLIEILKIVYFRLFLGFLVLLPIAFLVTLLISHTIAGPLVRIKRYLKLMAKGEFDLAPLVLRRYDELKEVAGLINQITAGLAPRHKERRGLIESLRSTVLALRSDLQRLPSTGQEIHRKVNFLMDTLKVLE